MILPKVFDHQRSTFSENQFFQIFGVPHSLPDKPSFLAIMSLLNALITLKSGFQSSLTPDYVHPHAPKFCGSPGRSFPGSDAIFGPIAALAREKSTKNTFSVVDPTLSKIAIFVPKITKIAISRKPLDRIDLNFAGALVMIKDTSSQIYMKIRVPPPHLRGTL